jgi:hypothetical protein
MARTEGQSVKQRSVADGYGSRHRGAVRRRLNHPVRPIPVVLNPSEATEVRICLLGAGCAAIDRERGHATRPSHSAQMRIRIAGVREQQSAFCRSRRPSKTAH